MNRHRNYTAASLLLVGFCMCATLALTADGQATRTPVAGDFKMTPKLEDAKKTAVAAGDRGTIKLTATGSDGKPLARKRFYLLEKNIQETGANWNSVPDRETFFKNASPALKEWLAKHDCDSLYCPEYETEYAKARETVPEFRQAYDAGIKKYKDPKLAIKWIAVNFPLKQARIGYYEKKRDWVEQTTKNAGRVLAVMTDEKGVAYFTKVAARSYYLSNVIPLEQGNILWNAEIAVPPLLPGKLQSISVEFTAPKPPAATPAASAPATP